MKIQSARFARAAHGEGDLVSDGLPQFAFAGRSNVGKSSLLNRLCGRKALARISSSPGRTRAINYFQINDRFYFVDLPGYGYAKVSKAERRRWAELLEAYLSRSGDATRLVQLVDGKVGATPLDIQAYEYFESLGRQPIVVATKIDRVPRGKRPAALRAIREALGAPDDLTLIPLSSRSGEGIHELWRELRARLDLPHLTAR